MVNSARGEIPRWWRRPGVWVVAVLLTTGLVLTLGTSVFRFVQLGDVREAAETVRTVDWPDGVTDWASACGTYGLKCGQSDLDPHAAVNAVAEQLRGAGLAVGDVGCGADAVVVRGSSLAELPRAETDCSAAARVGSAELSVVARDWLVGLDREDGIALGRTAVLVEWDSVGLEQMSRIEPARYLARFGETPISPAELADLPGALSTLECTDDDAGSGCLSLSGQVEGPGEGRDLVEAWAATLRDDGFLLTVFQCPAGESTFCTLGAVRGRPAGDPTLLSLMLDVVGDDPGVARVAVSVQ